MNNIVGNDFSEIYNDLLNLLVYNHRFESSPRGLKTLELLNIHLRFIPPYTNFFFNDYRSPKLTYLYPELLWYFLGKNDLNFISKYSKFWNNIANEDGTLNSAYGYLIFTERNAYGINEYGWAINSLIKDINSRQAILRFNKPHHSFIGNKDFVCTLNVIFNIRRDLIDNRLKLYMNVNMRSQDVWYGIIYDVPFFSLLHQQMHKHLKLYYPELEIGEYNHFVVSMHLYEKNLNDIKQMLNNKFTRYHIALDKYNLINEDGSPSSELLNLYEYVKNKNEYFIDDFLFNEIYKYTQLKYE